MAPRGSSRISRWLGALALLTSGACGAAAAQALGPLALEPAAEPEPEAPPSAHLARAELAYRAQDYELSYREYLEAVNGSGSREEAPDLAWLRLAQISYYENRDPESAWFFLGKAGAARLPPEERENRERLRRRLGFRALGPGILGLGDGNVSALKADGDDLWVGTWNGGVCRLSLASGRSRVFREGRESLVPSTVRCIEVTASRVWVGTYQGLFAYSKASGRWQEIQAFAGREPYKVEALRLAGGRLYVGTLGQGLWRQEGEGWRRISSGPLPGDFVTCLETAGEELLIGTLAQGVVRLRLAGLELSAFQDPQARLAAGNITVLLADPPRGFWIGTYGDGLYYWDRQAALLSRYSRAAGQLGDDWVLCGVRAENGAFFGTLGGGLARLAQGSWRVLGFREGVLSADVPALAYSPPFLYLGSLGAGVLELRVQQP